MPGREQHLGLTARRRREGKESVRKRKYTNIKIYNMLLLKTSITREEKKKERNKEKKKKKK